MNSTLNEKEFRPMGEPLSRLEEELAKLAQDFVSQKTSDSPPNSAPREPLQRDLTADPDDRISGSGWAARGLIGALLAAGIGVAGFIWWGATGEGAKRPPPPPAMSALPPQSPVQQAPVQEASSQRTSSQPTSSQPAPARPALSEPVTSTTVAPNLAPAAAAPADPMPLLQSM